MARKKTATTGRSKRKSSTAKKKAVTVRKKAGAVKKTKFTAKAKSAGVKKSKGSKQPGVKKRSGSTGRKKAAASRKTAKRKRPSSLGRPRVKADAKLDLVFQKDYKAREVFSFLNVTTLRELEELPADEIIARMTRPLVETVERIRKSLALMNRCLKKDLGYALEFRREIESLR